MEKDEIGVSRREFAKTAVLTTAAVLVPAELIAEQQEKPAPVTAEKPATPEPPKLSESSRAEADLAYQTLMRKYGSRFTDEQKKDIKRLVDQQQAGLDKVRAFVVTNSDQPGTVLKLYVPEVIR